IGHLILAVLMVAMISYQRLNRIFPYKGDTVIGNDVWLGYESTIMPGITIGDGAIVASKSVVTQDVPPYSIVGGNPAKVFKHRFEPHVVDKLLAIAWWDWSAEKITENLKAITQ
ncbi:CatB-related O-acetyltransferase, partial [Vibrio cholerae]